MGDKTGIEWTDATWNPVTGCSKVSQGCKNCYAERLFPRAYPGRKFTEVREHEDRLGQPGRWARPRMIFVNSMSDLFHEDVSDEFIAEVWFRMALNQHHTFQVLTKRPERMMSWLAHHGTWAVFYGERPEYEESLKKHGWPLRNVWCGVSIENQETAHERLPLLMQTPAAIRFVSYEPALGPVNISDYLSETCCWGDGTCNAGGIPC